MKSLYNDKTKQYLLKFATNAYLGEEDFLVTACNELAYKTITLWPCWSHFALDIFGPQSCGKSHLAHIWINHIQRTLQKPIEIPILPASAINMKNVNKFINKYQYLVVENIDTNIHEEALFHLYNAYNTPEHFILFNSLIPLSKILFKLPDLQSRLNTVPTAEILLPDDEMLTALIAKLFNDRQIMISQEILDYILKNAERSFNYISRLIEEIDDISWIYGRTVTIPIVREAMKNLSKNQQLDLFT
ncbi:MAG: hypothetical protein J6W96_06075 [Alphaproteobacteria bacterium]|nr:hypothetical protein [Alphaproteobacteria bacterium]